MSAGGVFALHGASALAAAPAPHSLLLCSGGEAGGIFSAGWDPANGDIGTMVQVAKVDSPAFLAFGTMRSGVFAYVVSEADGPRATVSAFAVDRRTNALRLLNVQPGVGDGPTHISVSPDGGVVAIASYSGHSMTTYRVERDGSLSPPVSHIQYTGHGPNAGRQQSAHAHSVRFTADGRFLLVSNFGLDQILIYRVNRNTGELTPNDVPVWSAVPGSGSRHIAFHPNGRWIYSLNELNSTVDILKWDGEAGRITLVGNVSSLPKDFPQDTAFSGEIVISPDGRNLYIGNRVASETIAVFRIDADGAKLKLVQLASNGGKNTRHFTIDPAGRWLVLCNIASGTIVVLQRSSATGMLSAPVHTYPLQMPMFAGFVPG
jgi:6-phosphogluconolactonase (cycloisomerase 2 family)